MKYTNRILNHPIVVSGQFVYRSSISAYDIGGNVHSAQCCKVKHIYSVRFTKIQQNKFNKAKQIC